MLFRFFLSNATRVQLHVTDTLYTICRLSGPFLYVQHSSGLLMLNPYTEPSPQARSIPHLAQEIIDKIIDELSFNIHTLRRCSTVSQSFYVPSRRHLFSIIGMETVEQVVRFHRLLIRAPNVRRNVRQLMLFLNNSWEELVDGDSEGMEYFVQLATVTVWLKFSHFSPALLRVSSTVSSGTGMNYPPVCDWLWLCYSNTRV
jgi:hypothetical protein